MDDRTSSSLSSESELLSEPIEPPPPTPPVYYSSDDWDRGDEPAKKVIQKIEFEKASRLAREAKSDLDKILNRVDQVICLFFKL